MYFLSHSSGFINCSFTLQAQHLCLQLISLLNKSNFFNLWRQVHWLIYYTTFGSLQSFRLIFCTHLLRRFGLKSRSHTTLMSPTFRLSSKIHRQAFTTEGFFKSCYGCVNFFNLLNCRIHHLLSTLINGFIFDVVKMNLQFCWWHIPRAHQFFYSIQISLICIGINFVKRIFYKGKFVSSWRICIFCFISQILNIYLGPVFFGFKLR